MSKSLELVRAGAGSGKTTNLCHTVAAAVKNGLDPARLLATTYTKKAAAELKGRMQAQLLMGPGERLAASRNAERLELAAIGTVHSVAHQLLSRFALELGLSPRLEVLAESAGERVLAELLENVHSPEGQSLSERATRLGLDDLPQRMRSLLAAKRGNRIGDLEFTSQMAASADRVCALLAPDGALSVAPSAERFSELVETALGSISALVNDTTDVTNKALQKLRQLKSGQLPYWGSYLEAIRIKAGKKSGADATLDALRNHASDVCRNPQLHADIREFSRWLAEETNRLDSEYRQYKTERGLVDFTDLEILFLRLLEDESLARRLAADFDLVLVDEFQDTNPLQLAIFHRLRFLCPSSRWVGDPKQAIYGFRDTDPKLVNEIWDHAADTTRTVLANNYRSQKGLVELVAALFVPVFGAEARQIPQKPTCPRGVERWVFNTKNQSDDAIALACGIARLHTEGTRFGDIAVLERINRSLTAVARALEDLGIPCLLECPGLLSTREGVIVLAGLRLVADRNDSLAAATLLHLMSDDGSDTPRWIEERLRDLAAQGIGTDRVYRKPWEGDPRLAHLEKLNRSLLSPAQTAHQVIEALGMPARVAHWSDSARRCSNLDSLLRHSREYEAAALENGDAATLTGLILHLERLAEAQLDVCYPPPGHDAVTLMTYHSAKGLEWPVVILSGLNSAREPDMWSPVVTGGVSGAADPLQGRRLRSWIWPFGKTESEFSKPRTGSGLEDRALNSEEGQERSEQARQENLRLLYVGCTRAQQKLVFAHRLGQCAWLQQLPGVDSLLDCNQGEGEHPLVGVETTWVLRQLDAGMADSTRVTLPKRQRWLSSKEPRMRSAFAPRFHSPSSAPQAVALHEVVSEDLPGASLFLPGADESQFAAVGDAVHAYLAALPSLAALSTDAKQAVAARCLTACAATGTLSPSEVVASGDRFLNWVAARYPGAKWQAEVAASGTRAAGGRWQGAMDLVLSLADGRVVLIDHKSAPIRRAQCATKAQQFTGQIAAYQEILSSQQQSVAATWIHFPLAGAMVQIPS